MFYVRHTHFGSGGKYYCPTFGSTKFIKIGLAVGRD